MKVRAFFAGYVTVDVGDEDEETFVQRIDAAMDAAAAKTEGQDVELHYDGVTHWGPVCRVCGCTDDEACDEGCSWVDGEDDLCSACVGKVPA